MISPVPINSMRFKRITAIRAEERNPSAGLPRRGVGTSEEADHLADRRAIILDMFDHFVAEDQVKRRGKERDKFPCRVYDMRRVGVRFGGALEVVFQSNDLAGKRGEMLYIHSHATAVFQNLSSNTFSGGTQDHLQAALLAGTPNI